MSEYLKDLKDVPEIKIHDFVCENNAIGDDGLAVMLDGIIGQEYMYFNERNGEEFKMLCVRSVTIIHEEVGEQATAKLKYIMRDLLQFHLSRLIFKNI